MLKVGDLVEINPLMKCDALQENLGLQDLDGTFTVLKVEDAMLCSCGTVNSSEHADDCNRKTHMRHGNKHWITIELPDGNNKRVSSLWLVAVGDEEA